MFFYKYIYVIAFLLIYLNIISIASMRNRELKVVKTGLDTVSPYSVGLQFFVDVNNTSSNDFEVETVPDRCCLDSGHSTDCNVLEMTSGSLEIIPRGKTKTLKLIAPLLDPLERRGFCVVFLDSKSTDTKRNVMRNTIKIPFDTRIKNKNQPMELPDGVKPCNIDEDPLNDCSPVDCRVFYNGKKSYYNNKLKRCVNVPCCISNTDVDIPNIVYDPFVNECVDEEALIKDDIEYLRGLVHGHRATKDIVIVKNFHEPKSKANNTWLEDQPKKDKHKLIKKPKEEYKIVTCKPKKINKKIIKPKTGNRKETFMDTAKKYLSTNIFTLSVLGIVILIQCFLICTMVYFLTRNCCCNRKKVVRKYFNYRQDASVTTPLIGTSNIDTETTDYQYISESSNIDKKIKCYKACQKERNNNAKMSLSDDILSKCLNRRDWNSKPIKSEAIQDYVNITNERKKLEGEKTNDEPNKRADPLRKKISDVRVLFENEIQSKQGSDKKNYVAKSIVKKLEDSKTKPKRKELNDSDVVLSEKEIKCHSYNFIENSNISSVKPSQESSNTGYNPSIHKLGFCKTETFKRDTASVSTEKGAQACFSNDSIDDFLSERGMLYLAGEDISKYSFITDSNASKTSETSEISSRTSKNNIIKNVLSFLSRKAKHGPCSDPGVKKSKENLDLELIHMSNVSVYSSSNNESGCNKSFKRVKDSRTSL